MGTKLYVGGLPWSMSSEDLQNAFAPHGQVVEAKVIEDRQTGRSRGFGFVTFSNEEEAKSALKLDGTEMDGRRIKVDMARERSGGGDRGDFGGGGGSGGGY
ncbi:MAG: RNA-binding protein [Candidatus Alcyoniella australis]|nr:RNA-binding protein [Candidatus Alcyoniella australis]